MNATIEVKQETAQALLELARSRGVSVDEVLQSLVGGSGSAQTPRVVDGAKRGQAFRAWASNHSKTTPLLSEEAVSRNGIYSR